MTVPREDRKTGADSKPVEQQREMLGAQGLQGDIPTKIAPIPVVCNAPRIRCKFVISCTLELER